MSYIFQKGLPIWDNYSGITSVKESTEWKYPTKSKMSTNTIGNLYRYYEFIKYDESKFAGFHVPLNTYDAIKIGTVLYIDNDDLYTGVDTVVAKLFMNVKYDTGSDFGYKDVYFIVTDKTKDLINIYLDYDDENKQFQIVGTTRVIERGVGERPSIRPNNYFTSSTKINNLTFNISDENDDNHSDGTIDETIKPSIQQQWNSLDNIHNNDTKKSTFLFNENIESVNKEIESPMLIIGGFDFDIPESAIINSVQIKIVRKNFAFNDRDFEYNNNENDWDERVGNGKYIPSVDDKLLNEYITTYTRDSVVTIHDSYDDFDDRYDYDNKAQIHKRENVKLQTLKCDAYNDANDFIINYDLISYSKPKNVWSNEKETIIYGNSENDLWGGKLTPEIFNNGSFCVKLKIWQKIFRGYGYKTFYRPDIADNHVSLKAWGGDWSSVLNKEYAMDTTWLDSYLDSNTISLPLASYLISRFYSVGVKVYYNIDNNGYKLNYDERLFYDNIQKPVKTDSVYFKYQKCLDGVCYKYVDSLNDIYKKDIITGDNKDINNMYNEFNIIDKYIPNMYNVDYATNENIDLNNSYYSIDGEEIKPNQLILLYGQDSASTNNIYRVTNNFTLINENLLMDNSLSYRAKIYVKYGTYKGKQLFLLPKSNNIFPIDNEEKYFEERHSYIIKHSINYDINNISNITPCKILFTNYDVARTLNDDTRNLYKPLQINVEHSIDTYLNISFYYRDITFYLSDKYGEYVTTFLTGITSAHTNSINIEDIGNTKIKVENDFYNKSEIGDYIELKFYETNEAKIETQRLIWYTQIKEKTGIDTIVTEALNKHHIDTIMRYESGYSYLVSNLNYVPGNDAREYVINFLKLPFKDLIDAVEIDTEIAILFDTKSDYYKYFNYGDVTITKNTIDSLSDEINTTENILFDTTNQYVNYKLKPFFDRFTLDPNFEISINNNETINDGEFSYSYTEEGNTNGLWKIYLDESYLYKIDSFKPYTYVYIIGDTFETKTLIREVTDTEIIMERPINYVSGTFDIKNISDFEEISDLLYDVYTNYTHDWYKKQEDSTRNRVYSMYAKMVKNNNMIRSQATGIIYQDDDKWNFDIFNINFDENLTNNLDPNLTYSPIEVLDVGVNNITKLQKPINIDNINIPDETKIEVFVGNSYALNNQIDNMSTLSYSDSNFYFGRWNDGFSGSSFDTSFTTNTNYYENDYLMLIELSSGFTQKNFYTIRSSDTLNNINSITPQQIKIINGKVHTISWLKNSNLVNIKCYKHTPYQYLGTRGAYLVNRKITPVHTIWDMETGSQTTTIYDGGIDYSNIFISDISYDEDSKVISGYYYSPYTQYNSYIGDMETYTKGQNTGYIYHEDKYENHFYISHFSRDYKSNTMRCDTITLAKNDYPTQVLVSNTIINSGFFPDNYRDRDIKLRNNGNTSVVSNVYAPEYSFTFFNLGENGEFKINDYLNYGKYKISTPHICNSYKAIYDNGDTYFVYSVSLKSFTAAHTCITKLTTNLMVNNNGIKYSNIEKLWENKIYTVLKYSNNINIVDMAIDNNYIYAVGSYKGELSFINNIKVDISNDKTFGLILKLDKLSGDVISAKEIHSTDTVNINSITITNNEMIDICGDFKGSVYMNGNKISKDNTEYFITRIKKEDI